MSSGPNIPRHERITSEVGLYLPPDCADALEQLVEASDSRSRSGVVRALLRVPHAEALDLVRRHLAPEDRRPAAVERGEVRPCGCKWIGRPRGGCSAPHAAKST